MRCHMCATMCPDKGKIQDVECQRWTKNYFAHESAKLSDNAKKMSYDGLNERRHELCEDLVKIQYQLKYDDKGDNDWRKKILFANAIKREELKIVKDELKSRTASSGSSISDAFMSAAKERLSPSAFDMIYQSAVKKINIS